MPETITLTSEQLNERIMEAVNSAFAGGMQGGTMTIPGTNPGVFRTPTGFILRPEDESTPIYWKRFNRAKIELSAMKVGPKSAVFIVEDERDRLEEFGTPKKNGRVCDVFGIKAAELIANRTHRIASPAEIERFNKEQREREDACAAIEDNRPDRRKDALMAKALTNLSDIAVKQQEQQEQRGIPASTAPDNPAFKADNSAFEPTAGFEQPRRGPGRPPVNKTEGGNS